MSGNSQTVLGHQYAGPHAIYIQEPVQTSHWLASARTPTCMLLPIPAEEPSGTRNGHGSFMSPTASKQSGSIVQSRLVQ